MTGDSEYNELFKPFTALVWKHEGKHYASAGSDLTVAGNV
jgi:hypothetical protein